MTATTKDRKDEATCMECVAFLDDKNQEIFGLCNNEKSDHYGHAVAFKHPACAALAVSGNGHCAFSLTE